MKDLKSLKRLAWEIRKEMLQVLRPKESHHIGCSFSIVEIVTYLYHKVLWVNPKKPHAPDRDIFILSKGHGALAVYANLYKQGFFSQQIFKSYDQDGGTLPEHITRNVPGVEFSAGSLGHGLPVAVGFALSYLNDKKKNKVFVLLSDGEFNEGSNWEAIMFAAHHRPHNLTVIVDLNGFQGYSTTRNVSDLSPLKQKLIDFGWNTFAANGHDFVSLSSTFAKIGKNTKPNIIFAKTTKGKGMPTFEGKFESHYQSLDEQTKEKIIKEFLQTK